jgi:hypothetical protein
VVEVDGVDELELDSDLAAVDSDEPLEVVPLDDSWDGAASFDEPLEPFEPFAPDRESVR